MFFRFFKEHKLFFIPHKTIANVLWLPIASSATFMFALPNQLYVIFTAFERWVKVVTSDFLNLTGHAGVEKQFVGLHQAVPQAKMSQSVLYLRENLPFLSFVSKNMALFKKNKPCQHSWYLQIDESWWLRTFYPPFNGVNRNLFITLLDAFRPLLLHSDSVEVT